MATTLQPEDSYRRRFLSGSVTDPPGIPGLGETTWKPPLDSYQEVHSDAFSLQDGEMLIGVSGTSPLADPTVATVLSSSTGGSLTPGDYTIGHTFKNPFGETLCSAKSTITLVSGQTRIVVGAITPLPTGATSVYWYMSRAANDVTLKRKSGNAGTTFNIDTLPTGAAEPTANTTGSSDHAEKGFIGGTNGIDVAYSPGSVDLALAVTGDIDVTGGVVTLTHDNGTVLDPTGPTDGQVRVYRATPNKLVFEDVIATSPATATAEGVMRVSVVPVDSAHPIAVGDNDSRVPTVPITNSPTTDGDVLTLVSGATAAQWATPAATVPDADSSTKGKVQLTGDFGGSAGSPQVAKIQGVAISGTPATGNVLTATGTTAAHWVAPTGGGTTINSGTSFPGSPADGDLFIRTDTTPVALYRYNLSITTWEITGDGTSGGTVPDADATTKGLIKLTNDFGGAATAPVVEAIQGVVISGTPASGNVLTATGSAAAHWAAPSGGGGGISSGTSFPGSPSNGDLFFRTDLGTLYEYVTGFSGPAPTWYSVSSDAITDSFTRANSSSSIGPADSFQKWIVRQGTWGISSNKLYCPSDTNSDTATITVNHSNFVIQLTTNGLVNGPTNFNLFQPLFKRLDIDNYLIVNFGGGVFYLIKRDGGANTTLATYTGTTTDSTDYTFCVVFNGADIDVYINGTLRISYTLTGSDLKYCDYTGIGFKLAQGGTTSAQARGSNLLIRPI